MVDEGSTSKADLLTDEIVQQILDQAEAAANGTPSLLRVDADGDQLGCRMRLYIVDLSGEVVRHRSDEVVGHRSMDDAWFGSIDIAIGKAFTAMAFSSNENALTTRSIGELSQPDKPLWQIGNSGTEYPIIEFPGGVPIYVDGKLVGGFGVSGDGVDQDETVAKAGVVGFEPPEAIRIDTVLKGAFNYTL